MTGKIPRANQMYLPFDAEGLGYDALADEAGDEAVGAASFILSLRARGIRDIALLRAMELVPRDVFAPRRFTDLSRTDVSLPLACGQTMTAPRTVATMLLALGVQPGHRILEIGTGSGYVTALLAKLGGEVVSVERFNTLAASAVQHLRIVEATTARIEVGDGLAARPRERFDRILLNGAWGDIPAPLLALVAPGGRVVGALKTEGLPRLVRVDRLDDDEFRQDYGANLRLAALLEGAATTL
ncbi:protein-L-isoaspartate O-methyltransferase family protein [Microvirga antarctica]|uniref:protein-L-isoaspartate O-methyltransferase family protein n=1 Tax=Microvirga antarctica TaxID=2819233 RepID=UPI001FE95058|nr:protein-L-isoaspartate O-methyltransferase [Microvirga antarctica]